MKIVIVGADKPIHEIACTHWSGLKTALARSGHEWEFISCRYNAKYIDQICESGADLIVYGLIDMMRDHEARIEIRQRMPNATIAVWYGDLRNERTDQVMGDLKPTVDYFLVSNDGQHDFIKKHFNMTPHFLPLAVDPIDEPVFDKDFERDFVFVGAKSFNHAFCERADIINKLEVQDKLHRIDGNTAEERAQVYWDMPKIYGNATCTLDISHFWDINKYVSNRFWVIPGYWGLALTKRFPGCEELYPSDTRVYWDDYDDLREKVAYYKANPDARAEMIRKGWEYTKAHHTYDHRVKELLRLTGFVDNK